MSTKKKMIVSIASMCVVLIVAVVSVIAVWAATRASVQSNISISYKVGHVTGTMRARIVDRSSTDDSQLSWGDLRTENGQGNALISYNKNHEASGTLGYFNEINMDNIFILGEYDLIQPMMVLEIQLTNSSSEPYNAILSTSKIDFQYVEEVYVVSDSYTGAFADYTPAISDYYNIYKNDETRDIVGDSGLEKSYQIKNDKTYCLYICVVSSRGCDKENFAINFALTLENAYATEV